MNREKIKNYLLIEEEIQKQIDRLQSTGDSSYAKLCNKIEWLYIYDYSTKSMPRVYVSDDLPLDDDGVPTAYPTELVYYFLGSWYVMSSLISRLDREGKKPQLMDWVKIKSNKIQLI